MCCRFAIERAIPIGMLSDYGSMMQQWGWLTPTNHPASAIRSLSRSRTSVPVTYVREVERSMMGARHLASQRNTRYGRLRAWRGRYYLPKQTLPRRQAAADPQTSTHPPTRDRSPAAEFHLLAAAKLQPTSSSSRAAALSALDGRDLPGGRAAVAVAVAATEAVETHAAARQHAAARRRS